MAKSKVAVVTDKETGVHYWPCGKPFEEDGRQFQQVRPIALSKKGETVLLERQSQELLKHIEEINYGEIEVDIIEY